jgi:hypothetical protein
LLLHSLRQIERARKKAIGFYPNVIDLLMWPQDAAALVLPLIVYQKMKRYATTKIKTIRSRPAGVTAKRITATSPALTQIFKFDVFFAITTGRSDTVLLNMMVA